MKISLYDSVFYRFYQYGLTANKKDPLWSAILLLGLMEWLVLMNIVWIGDILNFWDNPFKGRATGYVAGLFLLKNIYYFLWKQNASKIIKKSEALIKETSYRVERALNKTKAIVYSITAFSILIVFVYGNDSMNQRLDASSAPKRTKNEEYIEPKSSMDAWIEENNPVPYVGDTSKVVN
ncbi:MAG TPA: hypothetical protein VEC36_12885 [Patescibacteria group bacterium]|nr:hypothetical protein [Patescibacteria group bacterium]